MGGFVEWHPVPTATQLRSSVRQPPSRKRNHARPVGCRASRFPQKRQGSQQSRERSLLQSPLNLNRTCRYRYWCALALEWAAIWHRAFHASAPGGFMMPNDFTNDKGKKLFSKLGIKFSSRRKRAETGDLLRFSAGVRRRQVVSCLQNSNLLGTPEALCQHVDDRGIYIVDTVPYVLKLGHRGGAVDIAHLMIRLFDLRHECSKQFPFRLRIVVIAED